VFSVAVVNGYRHSYVVSHATVERSAVLHSVCWSTRVYRTSDAF